MPHDSNPDPSQRTISAIVLAAGASRRMGRPKMLLPWGNTTVIGQVITTLAQAGVVDPIIVTGRSADELQRILNDFTLRWVHNADYEATEMLQSLQLGIQHLPPEAEAFLVVLGDQPQMEPVTVRLLIERYQRQPAAVLIPSYRHRRGHPWLVRKELWPELLSLPEEANLRQFLNGHTREIEYLDVDNPSVLMDLDTPDQYQRSRPVDKTPANVEAILTWRLVYQDNEYQVTPHNMPAQVYSLDEVSKLLPGGAYTTLRTYFHNKVLRIEDHLNRLDESARRAGASVSIHPAALRTALRCILQGSPFSEARMRVTFALDVEPGSLYVSLEELHVPSAQAYLQGVATITRQMHRENPRAKLTRFIETAADFRSHLPAGVNELLMVREDEIILEGLSSNFFGVLAGRLLTMNEGVLPGITRGVVLDIIRQQGLPVDFGGVSIGEINSLDEAFITSASRAILPVVKIDQTTIADGRPGKITNLLMQAFSDWVAGQVEDL